MDIFADEGLSGTSSEKRENFQRMITMCELKQIDLVVTKSVSRFARNVKETLEYVRKLKLLGIGVVFESYINGNSLKPNPKASARISHGANAKTSR